VIGTTADVILGYVGKVVLYVDDAHVYMIGTTLHVILGYEWEVVHLYVGDARICMICLLLLP